nr:hypothetical protein [Tanacetum cinerariifolium]
MMEGSRESWVRWRSGRNSEEKQGEVGRKSGTIFRVPLYPFNYPTRRLTMEEIFIKFIDEALVQIPKYAKYPKSLLTNKSRHEEACTKTMNERCLAVLLNKLPLKEKAPRSFTMPCQVVEKHKEAEDLATYHLSMFENLHIKVLTEREIVDKFSNEHLMVLKSKFNNDEPWYADFINYIVGKVVPPNWTFEKRKRCVARNVTLEILAHCNSRPTGVHHSANVIVKKVYESGYYWPSVFMDANKYIRRCDACQRSRNISSWNEMPQNNIQLEKALQRYGVTHKLSMAYHPQSNGQTEVTNKAIKHILKRSVGCNPKDWSEKLNDALWAFRTAYKTSTTYTPFRLVYEKACHLPVEIEHKAHLALKQYNMDLMLAREIHVMQLNEFSELRNGAYENTRIYKEWTKK